MGHKILWVILISVCVPFIAWSQTDTSELKKLKELDEIVISGSKFSERKKNIAQKIDVIGAKELKALNMPTIADVLIQSGKVFVQKSQQGGGSPVVRGFEASRVLLMLDGVRMNNAIYRSGHLQNVISVDNNMLSSVEILNGPASTIYGSDALGGVVSMQTIKPRLTNEKEFKLSQAQAMLRYASANQENSVSTGFGFGNKHWGTFTNISLGSFKDLRQGGWDPNNQLATWGRNSYVQRINGIDSIVNNSNNLYQKNSGYSQMDLLQKITYAPNYNNIHQLNLQYSTTSDIPRYDRLTETSAGLPKHAEWYYGPQIRSLVAYQYDYFGERKLLNDFTMNLSHQFIEESRNTRRFQSDELSKRKEELNVLALNIAARIKLGNHEITYGGDAQVNFLKSTAFGQNVVTEQRSIIDTRYPDGDNNMNLYGAYVQHIYKFANGRFVLNDGLRINQSSLSSTIDNNLLNLPFTEINQNNRALTGNIGLIYFATKELRFNLNASRGFRSPNIDDAGKVFDSFSGELLVIPNENINPEYTNSVDLGVQYQTDKLFISAFGFYTQFLNAIVLDKTTFNGSDSIMYNGTLTPVFSNQNKAEAYLYGGGIEARIDLTKKIQFNANTSYTFGRYINAGYEVPLDHVPPLYGRVSLGYNEKKWGSQFFFLYNGTKRLEDYNINGRDNFKFALPTGTPSWYTINLRGHYNLNEHFKVQAGVDNIMDRNYRTFASGISAPGRNFILSLRYKM